MGKDPYRYFRIEAAELLEGLSQGLLRLEQSSSDLELVRRLLRQAHTLKGASRVVKQPDIGDLAHEIEDLLSPFRDGGGNIGRDTIDEALRRLDRIRALLDALGGDAGTAEPTRAEPPQPSSGEGSKSVRIAVRDLDALMEGALETHTAASSLQRITQELAEQRQRARDLHRTAFESASGRRRLASDLETFERDLDRLHRQVAERVDRVMTELGGLRALAAGLRLIPADTLIRDLERIVRDAARALDKDVEVVCTGASTHIDAHVLAGLRTALVHVVRNSVAHGIESRSERSAAGKSPVGQIHLSIERLGHRVRITCSDDGRGLDHDSVRNAAIERGLIDRNAAGASDENALGRLLLRGGISTTRRVTGVSGRGVGLETVHHAVSALKGEVTLQSHAGRGTTLVLVVPLSLSSVPTLLVEVIDEQFLVPLDSISQTLRLPHDELIQDAEGQRVVVDGEVTPFFDLARAMKRPRSPQAGKRSVVVIEAEGQRAAVGVDRIGVARNVVVRSIPEHAGAEPFVAGAAFGEEGAPQLVLAPPELVRLAADVRLSDATVSAHTPPPILVIDDSLTTRMLEQSILESAGYEVDLAVSGEEGLEKARSRRYGMFIVDVEMPGMSGFDFIAATRDDASLRDVPAILVTSRADREDKRRGKKVGARAYIVKSEFNQAELLETIRRLIG